MAGIALVALVALVAGQRFARQSNGEPAAAGTADFAGAAPAAVDQSRAAGAQAPDISGLTPAEAAARLYDRVMGAHERGREDTVQTFAPMAIAAYRMLGRLDADQRYDMGRIAAISGDEVLARAQADTILAQNPTHLLGLILSANAARMRRDTSAERRILNRLASLAPSERAKNLSEYAAHANDIDVALDQARRP